MRTILLIPIFALGASALIAASPSASASDRVAAQQCNRVRDQRVLDVVAVEIRGALAGHATEAEIRARITAAQERIRASGALSCGTVATTTPAVPVTTTEYGAIAIGSGGEWGVSWGQPNQHSAEERALRECTGTTCRVMVRVVGSACGAYASGTRGFGWGTDATREGAESRALRECQSRGGRCRVVAYTCNSRPG
ncbi:MAG TPA: DUF4189 domain-containing protein [Longimicrobium sp.]|nr:DUF4189 domain-containing protein [Longimicrobium sp.]